MESQNESDDEDVILPNSPLYQYFEPPVNEVDNAPPAQNGRNMFFRSFANRICDTSRELVETFVSYIDEFSNFFITEHHKVQRRLYDNVLRFADAKKLLIPEDAAFLRGCLSDMNNNEATEKPYLPKLGVALLISFVLLIVAFCGVHLETYLTLIESAILRQIVRKITIFVAAFNVSCFSYWALLLAYHVFKCSVVLNKARKLCNTTGMLIDILKKNYRIIQEFELIARGFTSASVLGIAQRLEMSTFLPISSPNRQLPELRKSLFIWTNDIFFSYRAATCYLIKITPISTESTSQYFATMPLKEFGVLLKFNPKSEGDFQELLKMSDNLSLSSLKAMHQLLVVQVSEFIKRFCLCFFHDSSMGAINYFLTFEKLNKYMHLLEETTNRDNKILSLAKHAYVLHRNLDIYKDKQSSDMPNSKVSPLYNSTVMIRNLNVHLKATLIKAVAIEDELVEEQDRLENNPEITTSFKENLLRGLKDIESELSISYECISEFKEKISLNTKPAEQMDEPVSTFINKNAEFRPAPLLISDSDPIIEDEVLEAIVRASDADGHDTPHTLTTDNSDEVKFDRKIARNLMQELKKILVVKAEEHRCREEKAMRAKVMKDAGTSDENVEDARQHEGSSADTASCDENLVDKTESSNEENQSCSEDTRDKLDQENDLLKLKFKMSENKSFAESIAEMASQRQQLLNLHNDTFECEEEILGDEEETDESQ